MVFIFLLVRTMHQSLIRIVLDTHAAQVKLSSLCNHFTLDIEKLIFCGYASLLSFEAELLP